MLMFFSAVLFEALFSTVTSKLSSSASPGEALITCSGVSMSVPQHRSCLMCRFVSFVSLRFVCPDSRSDCG